MELSDDIQELKQIIAQLLERISQLETENTQLKAENEQLRRRLGLKSHNSHKPPSSDGLAKKPALPKVSGKKNGGQVGHAGKTLRSVENPDEIVVHHAPECRCCGRKFSLADVEKIVQKRQVFDIPIPKIEVTEHQLGEISCCGEKYYGEFPAQVESSVQYGNKIKGLSVMLNNEYRLPLEKVEQLLRQLYGVSFNQGTMMSANEECYEKLEPIENRIKAEILASETAHFDETGMRIEGKLNWLHVASNKWWTYLFTHRKRGKVALESEQSLIKDFENNAVHDCWESYFRFENCRHILCNAHILRELENLKERGSEWGKEMKEFIFELYEASEKGGKVLTKRAEWEARYNQICEKGEVEEPPPEVKPKGRPKNSVGRNLLKRLKKYQAGIMEYAFREGIPFTNNQAERDIRCVKIKQKISNSFRSQTGAANYARIQGFVSTVKKQEMNIFAEIVNVFDNKNISFQMAR
jgi:transposase